MSAVLAGAVLTPLLLPWLPGRAFSLKGLLLGLGMAAVLAILGPFNGSLSDLLELIAWFLIVPAFTAYFAMNFTGASTYTSLSGVRKEMRWALPLQIGAGVIGFGLWLGSLWLA
jgi:acetyl-CoA decarbonylase/synthase complex subunit gamma